MCTCRQPALLYIAAPSITTANSCPGPKPLGLGGCTSGPQFSRWTQERGECREFQVQCTVQKRKQTLWLHVLDPPNAPPRGKGQATHRRMQSEASKAERPGQAPSHLGLRETLFKEWYVCLPLDRELFMSKNCFLIHCCQQNHKMPTSNE